MTTGEACGRLDAGCALKEGLGNLLGDLGQSAMAPFIEGLYNGSLNQMKIIQGMWINTPNPDVGSDALSLLRGDLQYFVFIFGVIGFLIGMIRLILSQDVRSSAISLGTQVLNMLLATGAYMVAIPLLLKAGDSTALWLLERSGQGEPDFGKLLAGGATLATNLGAMFIIYLLMFISALVNIVFLLFRNLMFLVLMAFLPVVAAASTTESGKQAWRKANGWLLALVLYKPVAAGIYALGFRLIGEGVDKASADEGLASMSTSLMGLLIITLAGLALPALVKFVVPAAGVGAGAFSGGAALGAGIGAGVSVAAGAAVLAPAMAGAVAAGGAARGAAAAGSAVSSAGSAAGGGSTAGGASSTGGSGGGAGPSGTGGSGTAGGSSQGGENAHAADGAPAPASESSNALGGSTSSNESSVAGGSPAGGGTAGGASGSGGLAATDATGAQSGGSSGSAGNGATTASGAGSSRGSGTAASGAGSTSGSVGQSGGSSAASGARSVANGVGKAAAIRQSIQGLNPGSGVAEGAAQIENMVDPDEEGSK
ncbi:hypothetical protein [Neomicrococcus lactis]|uniref:Conjugal transfer protein TrbL n=1 Tax=Neomicrococcus lactis TaxID=732241 RepID=A0A7W8YD39_9MICC|nr:hypothetical protein [Neomicrococcus lactis]MBB5599355.1 hypothetical protein [Neomicrococcus lactis]